MDYIIFGGFTLENLLMVVGVAVVLWVGVKVMKKVLVGQEEGDADDPYLQPVTCSSCGWQGRVSSFAGRCPKCRSPLGDRSARNDRNRR